jgi:hypothetical protein
LFGNRENQAKEPAAKHLFFAAGSFFAIFNNFPVQFCSSPTGANVSCTISAQARVFHAKPSIQQYVRTPELPVPE